MENIATSIEQPIPLADPMAGSVVDGAMAAMDNTIHEKSLGEPNLTGQKALASIGFDSLLNKNEPLFGSESKLRSDIEAPQINVLPPMGEGPGLVNSIEHYSDLSEKANEVENRYAILKPIEDASLQAERNINSSTNSIFKYNSEVKKEKLVPENTEDTLSKFEKVRENVLSLQTNPDAFQSRLTQATDHLYPHAPNITEAIQASTIRAVNFLASKIPKEPQQMALSPKWVPAQSDISKFNKYYEAVNNPSSALKQIKSGTLTQEAVEAISQVHPDLYASMQTKLIDKITDQKKPIPYNTQQSLSLFLGQPLSYAFSPDSIMRNQQAHMGPSQQTGENIAKPRRANEAGLSKLSVAERSLTPMQKSNRRIE